jgi:hypothetical protein
MKSKKALYLFPFFLIIGSFSPVRGIVASGMVRDSGGTPVSSARVSFILASDTTITFLGRTDQHGHYTVNIDENAAVDRDHSNPNFPCAITLFQNFPNPFNPATCISFEIDRELPVSLIVANILGQTVRVLINEKLNAGSHTVFWDGRRDNGRGVSAGLYFCLLKAGGEVFRRKMILLDGTFTLSGAMHSQPGSLLKSCFSESTNEYNIVITGKGIVPYSLNGISVDTDTLLNFTVVRAPVKHPVLDKSVTVDGGARGDDAAYGFILDKDGNMYVTGFVTVSNEDRNIWLAKYDSDMNVVISKNINGSGNGEDTGYTFAMDNHDNLYIIGYITETGQDHNIWIAKYDLDLSLQKQITVNGSKNETDDGYGIIFDGAGYLYAAGTVREIEGENNIWIAKYDTDLNLITNITINRFDNDTDKARFMILDGKGHLFVSGSVTQEVTDYDIWIGKFDTDLHLLAETDVAGPVAGEEDKGYGICLDEFGILYCAGTLTEPGQGYNIWLAKYDPDLNPIKSITRDGPLHGEDVAYLMAMDEAGFLYLTGVYSEPAGNENAWIGIYNRDLQLQNETTVDGASHGYDSGMGIACRGNMLYVSGFLTVLSESGNIWLARYRLSDP